MSHELDSTAAAYGLTELLLLLEGAISSSFISFTFFTIAL